MSLRACLTVTQTDTEGDRGRENQKVGDRGWIYSHVKSTAVAAAAPGRGSKAACAASQQQYGLKQAHLPNY